MGEYVYAVHSIDKGLIKIGYSKQPEIRINALRYAWGSPLPLMILSIVQIENARLSEKALHWQFDEFREQGEWFRLIPNDLIEWMNVSRLEELMEKYLSVYPFSHQPKRYHPSESTTRQYEDIKDLNINEFGKRIRSRRAYMGMNQAELGRRVGLNRSSIWAIENGKKGVGLAAAYRICQALDFVSLDEMIGQNHDSAAT